MTKEENDFLNLLKEIPLHINRKQKLIKELDSYKSISLILRFSNKPILYDGYKFYAISIKDGGVIGYVKYTHLYYNDTPCIIISIMGIKRNIYRTNTLTKSYIGDKIQEIIDELDCFMELD